MEIEQRKVSRNEGQLQGINDPVNLADKTG